MSCVRKGSFLPSPLSLRVASQQVHMHMSLRRAFSLPPWRRLAYHLHLEALIARRTFWETLLHSQVTFIKVARACKRIDQTVKAAERMYKQVRRGPGHDLTLMVVIW